MDIRELKRKQIWLPYIINDGKKPSLNGKEPFKWSRCDFRLPYAEAIDCMDRTPGLAGIGFVVPIGILVIDLDKCVADGAVNEAVKGIMAEAGTYAELSPSKTGLHLIGINDTHRVHIAHDILINGQKVELKPAGNHYITFTEDRVNELDLQDCTTFFKKYDPVPKPRVVNSEAIKTPRKAAKTSAYGLAALTRECNLIKVAESRHTQVYTSAKAIGELVAGGEILEAEARSDLVRAGKASGLTQAKAEENTNSGLMVGMRSPRAAKA